MLDDGGIHPRSIGVRQALDDDVDASLQDVVQEPYAFDEVFPLLASNNGVEILEQRLLGLIRDVVDHAAQVVCPLAAPLSVDDSLNPQRLREDRYDASSLSLQPRLDAGGDLGSNCRVHRPDLSRPVGSKVRAADRSESRPSQRSIGNVRRRSKGERTRHSLDARRARRRAGELVAKVIVDERANEAAERGDLQVCRRAPNLKGCREVKCPWREGECACVEEAQGEVEGRGRKGRRRKMDVAGFGVGVGREELSRKVGRPRG